VAESIDDDTCGSVFGWMQHASCNEGISPCFVGLLLAQTTVLGSAGWRIAFQLMAVISVAVGARRATGVGGDDRGAAAAKLGLRLSRDREEREEHVETGYFGPTG
jgi:hypothetical protein